MATVESNFFEIQRRAYQWNQYSTLDDGVTPMGWDNDPNLAQDGNTPGESKLVSMPIGAFYIQSNGTLYYKSQSPNTWSIVATSDSSSNAQFYSYDFTDALEWIVNHNKNTRIFSEVLYDQSGNKFYAPVSIIDDNSFRVRLTSATSGRISVMFA